MASSIFRRKSLDKIIRDAEAGLGDAHEHKMQKVLGVRDLTFMGIAAVIGAGIFSTIGTAAFHGGPGVIFLFLITAITCGFTALCYAEFASRVPVAGSAYTYSYVSFGEVIAWIIGWALILEYAIGNVVVAISWSAYFNNILRNMGIHLPDWLATGYQSAKMTYQAALDAHKPVADAGISQRSATSEGIKFIINLPAFIIVMLITALAYIGINESRKSANFMVRSNWWSWFSSRCWVFGLFFLPAPPATGNHSFRKEWEASCKACPPYFLPISVLMPSPLQPKSAAIRKKIFPKA